MAPQSFVLPNLTCANDLIALLHVIIDGMIRLAIPITVIMIVWAAVMYIISRGDGVQKATNAVIWAALGFGLLLIASGIISVIQEFFGVTASSPTLGGTTGCGTSPITPQGPTSLADVVKIFTDISGWLFTFAIIAGVAMIIVGGISYIFARDNAGKASRALNIVIYAVIGIAIAALAWAIINIVANFLTGKPIFATLISEAYAQSSPFTAQRPPNAPTGGPATLTDVLKLIQDVVGWLFVFAIIAGVAMIIISGILYILGRNPQGARSALLYAVIGIAIAALAWAIVNLIGNFFVGTPLLGTGSGGGGGATTYVCQGGGIKSGNTYGDQAMCTSDCTGGSCTTAQAGDYVCQGPTIHAGNTYGDQALCQGQCEAGGGICVAL